MSKNNKVKIFKIILTIIVLILIIGIIAYLFPVMKDLLVYIAGLLPTKPLKFILISSIARFPSVISSTLAGENLAVGDWEMSIILYAIVFILVAIIVFIINKFDKDKTTNEALKIIK